MKMRQMRSMLFLLLLLVLTPCAMKVRAEEGTPVAYVVEDGVGRMIYDDELEYGTDLELDLYECKVAEVALNADLGDIFIMGEEDMDISLNLQGHHVRDVTLNFNLSLTMGDSVGGGLIDEVTVRSGGKITANNLAMGEITADGEFVMNGGSAKKVWDGGKFVMNGGSIVSEGDSPDASAVSCYGRFELIDGTISSKNRGITVENGADILIKGGTVHGDQQGIATYVSIDKESWAANYYLYNDATASVQIDGGKITGYVGVLNDELEKWNKCGALVLGGVEKIVINGGEFTGAVNLCTNVVDFSVGLTNCTVKNGVFHNEIRVGSVCSVTIDDGTFSGGLKLDGSGTVTIQGGTFSPLRAEHDWEEGYPKNAISMSPTGTGKVCVNGGSFTGGLKCSFWEKGEDMLCVNGGSFVGDLDCYFSSGSTGNEVSLAGGTFKASGEEKVSIYVGGDAPSVNLLSLLAPGYTYAGDPDYVLPDKTRLDAPTKIEIKAGKAALPVNVYVDMSDMEGFPYAIKMRIYGAVYGDTIPEKTPVRKGYTFDGWYTEKTGGTKVTADSVFTEYSDVTLYAHWTKNKDETEDTKDPENPDDQDDPGDISDEKPKLDRTKLSLTVGEETTLEVSGTSGKVSWKSSNKKVAAVKNGKITAKKKGKAKITATVGEKKLVCKVTVKKKSSAETPMLSSTRLTLTVGEKATLEVSGTDKKVSWKSSNRKVVTVKNGRITAKKKGKAKITATVGGKKLVCKVTVEAKTQGMAKVKKYKPLGEDAALAWNYYEVGKKTAEGECIPAGEYVIFVEDGVKYGVYALQDSPEDRESNLGGNVQGNTYVKLKVGQYLYLSDCYAVPAAKAAVKTDGPGVYRIGRDIKAGTYTLKATGSEENYCIFDSIGSLTEWYALYDTEVIDNIDFGSFTGTTMVTVKNGQYLMLKNCRIEK